MADDVTESVATGTPRGHCKLPDCTVAVDGVCLRGRDPLDCDAFELEAELEEGPAAAQPTRPRVPIPFGKALLASDLSVVLARRRASRVVPLGAIEAGKTTLFAVLFELLAAGRLDHWSYVWSATTLAFAERSHDASVRSGRSEPVVGRTSRAASNQLLHIEARRREDESLRDALFADVSGEYVEQLATGRARDRSLLDALEASSHIPILVDGRQAADGKERQHAIRQAIDLIHVLADLGVPRHCRVSVVLTKVDCFSEDGLADEVVGRVAEAVAARLGTSPATFQTAALPKCNASVPFGFGLDDLLGHLLDLPQPEWTAKPEMATTPVSGVVLRRIWDGVR